MYLVVVKARKTIIGLILMVSILAPLFGSSQCTDMDSDKIKNLLGDAVYDNFRRTIIENAKDPYDVEFQVDLLKNFTYNLIFDMSGKPEGVVVKLYDLGKKGETSAPKLLYTSSEDIMNENATFDISFEAPKTKMLVKYEVKDATYEGCVTFLLGVFLRDKTKSH